MWVIVQDVGGVKRRKRGKMALRWMGLVIYTERR
jgi:hypothetical protein